MPTPADLTTRFPALASTPQATLQAHLDAAARLLHQPTWGDLYTEGQLYLAAHLVASASMGGGQGATSVSAGSASVSYGDPTSRLDATPYGAHYRMLARMVAGSRVL